MIVKISGATVGATAHTYSAGQLVGTKLNLGNLQHAGAREPILCAVTVTDLTKQSSALNILFFDSDPSGTTFTDNAALDVADADLPKVIGIVPVAATDYVALNDNSVGCVRNVSLPLRPATMEADLYACVVCNGTPTYVANELGVSFSFLR